MHRTLLHALVLVVLLPLLLDAIIVVLRVDFTMPIFFILMISFIIFVTFHLPRALRINAPLVGSRIPLAADVGSTANRHGCRCATKA